MRIDLGAIMAIFYCVVLLMQAKRLFDQGRKHAITSVVSGTALFIYATGLYMTNQNVSNRTFIVILAMSLLQIAAFDVNRSPDKKKNIQRQLVLLMFHVSMAYFMLR